MSSDVNITKRHYNESVSLKDALQKKINVMHAVILRDIRSRYFNHGLGFLIVPLFPTAHLVLLLVFYTVIGRDATFGDDTRLFFATGLMPALSFMYVSRFMSISLLSNKSMMAFPIVRLLDIVIARAFLEIIGIIIATVFIICILLANGSDPWPRDLAQAGIGMLLIFITSIGVGIIASVITAIVPVFALIYALSMIIIYLTSGAPIYLHSMPSQVLDVVSWSPAFQAVEWVRSAYYLGYPDHYLNKTYLVGFAVGSLAIGLLMERTLRRVVLSG